MAAPSPATGVAWDVDSPDNAQVHGNDFLEHRETKLAVGLRMTKEHVAFAGSSVGGEHKEGSANIYVGDYSVSAAGDALPTTKPDGATALDTNDKGRMAYDTDAVYGGLLYKWTGSAWAQFGVMLTGSQTIAGVKTFSSFPVTPSSAPTTDYQVTNKKYVDDTPHTGGIVQIVNTQTGAYASGTTVIPYDDTIPQIDEGDQYMSLAITPKSATNKLKIDVVACLATAANFQHICAALFQDSTAAALACVYEYGYTSDEKIIRFTHYMTAGTTLATTFKVRAGNGGTTYFNGSAARKYGGVLASSITIMEIKV